MSIKSAVTISLVKEAEGGPFIFWHDLAAGVLGQALGQDDALGLLEAGEAFAAPSQQILSSITIRATT